MKRIAVDATVVVFNKFLTLRVEGTVKLTLKTLLFFVLDNLVQITLKFKQLKSVTLSELYFLSLSLHRFFTFLSRVQILSIKNKIIQNILHLLPYQPACDGG
jgi:hypothetical protein